MAKLTISIIEEYQKRRDKLRTIGEFKALGRELRDKFNLTDMQAINILNRKSDEIFQILKERENNELCC